ncbi:proline dehydrogenase family protein [Salinimicrobium xinjiangense]|uniref:proline dehydrogenase family protein n=1 Tax=Salinimicrobium xinjiangense TaxID=438596 RepID=UPI0003FB443E|nr:proline dehydrogenase family protein [Salinimicrobium xinjiangense]
MITKKIFNDTETAFRLKSDSELNRAIFLFEMIDRPLLVKAGTTMTNLALKVHLPVETLIKKTVFNQFCGGVTEKDCLPTIEKMYSKNLHSILDYSVEGKEKESEFEKAIERKTNIVKFISGREEMPFAVFKPTGIGRFELWQKVSANASLSLEEEEEWQRVKNRVNRICEEAYKQGVRLLADAEESWMQDAADILIEEMMFKYNREKAIIFNTLQCYRWDRMQYIKDLHSRAKEQGFIVGAKIVRGAYLEKENERAAKMGYLSPICENKEATDVNYNGVLTYCLAHIDDISVFIGSHNEMSNYLALQIMEDKGIDKNDDRVWFSQLFGMSEHISYNLAEAGYNVAKLVPFGPVREVVPYLIRRAEENTSVKGQTGRELALLYEERKRRGGEITKSNRENELVS